MTFTSFPSMDGVGKVRELLLFGSYNSRLNSHPVISNGNIKSNNKFLSFIYNPSLNIFYE
jgi:hypothetical protein